MNHDAPAYGLWLLVLVNSAVFIMFAFSFFKPQTSRDWRTFGTFAAFIVALFVEMYGFPLTLYVLSGWLQTKYPSLDLLSHNSGHLWSTLLGESGDPHFSPLHIASYIFIGGGFWLLSSAWTVLYHAQRHAQLAVSGPYARIRHPQYVAFVAILFGFLLQLADAVDAADVPLPRRDVFEAGCQRGEGHAQAVRRRVRRLCRAHAALPSLPLGHAPARLT